MNKDIERPGVAPGWERYWRRIVKGHEDPLNSEHQTRRAKELKQYFSEGFISAPVGYETPNAPVVPPRQHWEAYLDSSLSGYGDFFEFSLERSLLADNPDWAAGQAAFSAAYLSQMIRMQIHLLFPLRFQGRNLKMLFVRDIGYTSLGLVLGCEPQATILARAQLAAYRKGHYSDATHYPIYIFIFRVLADYLENTTIEVVGETLQEPIFQQLFQQWKTTDLSELEYICLAALDLHTHRCKVGDAKNFYEFEAGIWTQIPIEIWLIFKLRERMGLANPILDHPMMSGAFGVSPPTVGFKADPLIAAVYERMKQDGFDEQEISDRLNA